MAKLGLRGAFTALVTPFEVGGSAIDYGAYERLVEAQVSAGIAGLVPCGTTGESPTLSEAEQRELVKRTVALVKGRIPVIAGTGSNSTKKSIELSKAALDAGADAVMIVMPYYNKPSQEGMVQHVQSIAQAVPAPIVLYNIPARTGVELSVESVLRILDSCPQVIGIKDATGTMLHCQELLLRAAGRVTVLSGDDPLTLPMMSVGASGVISVTSNLFPGPVSEVCADVVAGRWEAARNKHLALFPVHRALFSEPSPAPTKAALSERGLMNSAVRLPLCEASAACRSHLALVLKTYQGDV